MKKLKVLSLFSGIGMFDYGLDKTGGFETIAFCEQDERCQKVLEKHWLEVPIFTNVLNLTGNSYKRRMQLYGIGGLEIVNDPLDVVTASWPCQGHSVAGKKKGLDDGRSGLWKEVKRILQETQPGWFIGENSANLRTNGLTEVLQDLWEIGYRDIRWDILPAEAYGAIHKRERIFILANRNSIRLDDATYAPTQEESNRRTEAWSDFSNGQCPKPTFYRVDDAYSKGLVLSGLHKDCERARKERVKQCGNSLYWPIVEKIGNYIIKKQNE